MAPEGYAKCRKPRGVISVIWHWGVMLRHIRKKAGVRFACLGDEQWLAWSLKGNFEQIRKIATSNTTKHIVAKYKAGLPAHGSQTGSFNFTMFESNHLQSWILINILIAWYHP